MCQLNGANWYSILEHDVYSERSRKTWNQLFEKLQCFISQKVSKAMFNYKDKKKNLRMAELQQMLWSLNVFGTDG